MEKHCDSEKRFGKEGYDVEALIDKLTEELLAKTREALRSGGNQARRQIVKTTLRLERLLGEVRP